MYILMCETFNNLNQKNSILLDYVLYWIIKFCQNDIKFDINVLMCNTIYLINKQFIILNKL